jgi:endonuclease YncB( thermonuclease family)
MSFIARFFIFWIFVATAFSSEWTTLDDCRLIPNEYNDGDSFHVEHDGEEFIFRLYFVDCPEAENSFPERVEEQAQYFGITPEKSIEVGRYAKAATEQILSDGFKVVTRWQKALGRSKLPRFYAFVLVEGQDPKTEDLNAILVSNGLARLHGVKASAPDFPSAVELESQYENLEEEAKVDGYGAWGKKDEIRRMQ